jgi:hypothetical protein
MLFPWVGMFEQICLADTFVFYDDVPFSKGSFTNRVQLKSKKGSQWLSIPIQKFHLGQHINELTASQNVNWREKHLKQLEECYSSTPFFSDMMTLVNSVYQIDSENLSDIVCASMIAVCDYFELSDNTSFHYSSHYNIEGKSSSRVLNCALHFNASEYVTGHGATNYLDHNLFESNNIGVEYMDYKKTPYKQCFGDFTPYVSIVDLIANCGKSGKEYIHSKTVNWRSQVTEGSNHDK